MMKRMEQWSGRVAVVCDFAGSPTCLAICKDLVNNGLIVCGLTSSEGIRDLHKLNKTLAEAKGQLIPMEFDVKEEGSIAPVFRWIGEKYEGIDLLINNVNCMRVGGILDDGNTQDLRHVMVSNIMGMCLVIREGARQMKQRPAERKNIGHIVNILSTVGQKMDSVTQNLTINGLYPAGRHSAKAITECVRQELLYMDENVKTTMISPGHVEYDVITSVGEEKTSALSGSDVSSAIMYAISVKSNVQIQEIVIKPVGDFL